MSDVKIAYGSSAALTITLAELATSATLVAGQESTAIDNTSNLYQDYLLAGKITTGTSPTVSKTIEVWVYASTDDTPTYPDDATGTNGAMESTTADIKSSSMALAASMTVSATNDVTYWFGAISVASLFGGVMPKHFGVFVVHDTAVNLHATGSNHAISVTPVYNTVT